MNAYPLTLEVDKAVGGVTLRVLGHWPTAVRASFVLEVGGGGNRSTHRGAASLHAAERATLSTISVATAPTGAWEAALEVELPDGTFYRLVEHSG
ncbi:curli-like amyloid fiber formation chaperone CsgH [Sphingomonas sp.]|uniref:curli-like amyloid fiber formation chaperone CsgH n=1 Tax=Sphingomonas sp. TaxID=28214 RepID=UPI002D7EA43D|nr:curli-like amyloid fiber formation chaperone CsgH [Sphingomonas sp.]HEU0044542.1 curli-like amyloid fiber formation chaperone CsgH [Sphingomonas sp.]